MTAYLTLLTMLLGFSLRNRSAVSFIFPRTNPEIYSGCIYFSSPLNWTLITGLLPAPCSTAKGQLLRSSLRAASLYFIPISLLEPYTVFLAFLCPWLTAAYPTRWQSLVNATCDGVVGIPSALLIISTLLSRHTPIHELVVPRSIPIAISESIYWFSYIELINFNII